MHVALLANYEIVHKNLNTCQRLDYIHIAQAKRQGVSYKKRYKPYGNFALFLIGSLKPTDRFSLRKKLVFVTDCYTKMFGRGRS